MIGRKFFLFLVLCSVQLLTGSGYICNSTVTTNRSPVIGVLAQETWNDGLPPNNTVIVAGYVKYLEMAGAQVVPVLLNKSDEYYDTLYNKLNGLLLPGGSLLNDSIYMRTAAKFWLKATNNNTNLSWRSNAERKCNFFPIWGTCLGMEFMLDFISGEPSRLTRCNAFDTANSVHLTRPNEKMREKTKLFKNAPVKILNLLKHKKTTVNFHHRCMSMSNVTKYNLNRNIRILGTNRDKDGLKHVSIFESKFYPFFGVQFHPEVVLFEFKDFRGHHHIMHDFDAVQVSQYFANFFVGQTRKNKNCFDSEEELNAYSIHNFQPQFTALSKTERKIQKYFFALGDDLHSTEQTDR